MPEKRREAGTGSIYFRADRQQWIAQIDITRSGDTRRRFKRKAFDTESKARAQVKTWREHTLTITAPTGPLLNDWLDRWLLSRRVTQLAATTRAQYTDVSRLHIRPHLGPVRLGQLTQGRLDRWLDDLTDAGVGRASVVAARNVLRIALAYAVRRDLLQHNPLTGLRLERGRPAPTVRALTLDELKRLLDAAVPWVRTGIAVMALGGLRRGELLGLQWDDLDWTAGTLRVHRSIVAKVDRADGKIGPGIKAPKTTAGKRAVPLPPLALEFLVGHRRAVELDAMMRRRTIPAWIVPSSRGSWMQPRNFNRAFARAVRDAELSGRVRVHDLRHTCATALLALGAEVGAVAAYLGHADGGRTLQRTYNHPTVDAQRKGAAALAQSFAILRPRV